MTPEKDINVESQRITVRILKGILRGCDFTLVPGGNYFFIGDEETINQHQKCNNSSDDIIYIPTEVVQAACRFTINVSLTDKSPAILLIDEECSEKRSIALNFNRVIYIGNICFSIRPYGQDFDESLLYYADAPVKNQKKIKNKFATFLIWVKYLLPVSIIFATCALTYGIMSNEGKRFASIASIIDLNPSTYTLFHGRDGAYYVITINEADANWIRQTLIRISLPYDVRVVTGREEISRLTDFIKISLPNLHFHRIVFKDSGAMVLELSKERNQLTEVDEKKIIGKILDHVPFVPELKIKYISDVMVSNIVEEDLKKIFVEYNKSINEGGVTFVLAGSINDGELERIKVFINDYYRRWGGEYVTFAIELKDDWLTGKSFKYGDNGYIKLSPGHWYFPKTL